jgi:hypothetical protein
MASKDANGVRRETQKEESTTAAQEIKAHAKQILSVRALFRVLFFEAVN